MCYAENQKAYFTGLLQYRLKIDPQIAVTLFTIRTKSIFWRNPLSAFAGTWRQTQKNHDLTPRIWKTIEPTKKTVALPLVMESELRNIPVVNTPSEKHLVGSLSRAQILAIFSEAIAEKSKPAG